MSRGRLERKRVVIGAAVLYLGDCREILPMPERTDTLLLTDPPYGIGYLNHKRSHASGLYRGRSQEPKHRMKSIAGDGETFDPRHLLGCTGDLFILGADHFASMLPAGGTWVAWDKHCGRGPNDSYTDCEFAWTNATIKRNVIRYLWKGLACQKAGEDNGRRYHPTMKPQGLMNAVLDCFPAARSVLDPYMGSGSTGVAAVRRGLAFTGIEIDPDYFEIACRRITDAQRQGPLFDEQRTQNQREQTYAAA